MKTTLRKKNISTNLIVIKYNFIIANEAKFYWINAIIYLKTYSKHYWKIKNRTKILHQLNEILIQINDKNF